MYLELCISFTMIIIITYLVLTLRLTNNKKQVHNTVEPPFGIPREIDNIKPILKPSTFHKKFKKTVRFNPANNTEHYESNAIRLN